jgi:hypothetical protein
MPRKTILPVLLATIWVGLSEFARNQLLFPALWTEHYRSLGLVFPAAPINGAMWGVWSLLFAVAVFVLSRRFTLWETGLLAWLVGFVLMWVVIGNLGVLPWSILYAAVPLSLVEAFGAAFIVTRFRPASGPGGTGR